MTASIPLPMQRMKKGKGGIVNTASIASFAAHHGFATYISSKHAMAGLSKSMAWELGPEIRVNAIAPRAGVRLIGKNVRVGTLGRILCA